LYVGGCWLNMVSHLEILMVSLLEISKGISLGDFKIISQRGSIKCL